IHTHTHTHTHTPLHTPNSTPLHTTNTAHQYTHTHTHAHSEMRTNISKCMLIQNTKYPSNKCIKIKYKILVPENVAKFNTCILYLKYRKYFFWIFRFLSLV